ncbi:TetR/AcrR family transcriptional regulator [Paractinoplanes deccanensis]|uniref:TetR/AcrR family transcriptional regulator n=1 Tax=Paractinoplanes deccanensis TaxID=113561 RepID=UPI0031E309EE
MAVQLGWLERATAPALRERSIPSVRIAERNVPFRYGGGMAISARALRAAQNDAAILGAARDVFIADKRAPISDVAERAGVGISALYRRYANKEDLLRTLCHGGLKLFIAAAEDARDDPDGWSAFEGFLRTVVEADVHSLTVHLAGTFTPTEDMNADAVRASELVAELLERARPAVRSGFVLADVTMVLEMCAAVRVPDAERTKVLRDRYLTLVLDGIRAGDELPGPEPTDAEFGWRWRR